MFDITSYLQEIAFHNDPASSDIVHMPPSQSVRLFCDHRLTREE